MALVLALALAPQVFALTIERPPQQTVPTLTPSGQPPAPSPAPPGTQPPPPPALPPTTPAGPTPTPLELAPGAGALRLAVDRVAVRAGEVLTYTLELAHRGEVAAPEVTVTDDLDPALSPLRVEATQGQAQVSGQRLVVELGTLLPGQVARIVLRAQVSWGAPDGLVIVNQAQAQWGQIVILSNEAAVALPPADLPATGAALPGRW
jgi:uncharacterized repeat protein (TIGR01451 family)